MKELLELVNVSCYSEKKIRLKDINLSIKRNERIALLGKSGSGKSTLISISNGSLLPNTGNVLWKGKVINKHSKRELSNIGTIWQNLFLIEELNVAQNINCGALGRHNFIWSLRNLFGSIDKEICETCLNSVQLSNEIIHYQLNRLSGGQRKRVAIARLLRQQPEIVLADEPFSSLDPLLSKKILELFISRKRINSLRIPETLLISLHQTELLNNFDRVIALKNGGVILDTSTRKVTPEQINSIY